MLIGEETKRLIFRELRECDFSDWLRFCREPTSLEYISLSDNKELSSDDLCRIWFDKIFNRYETNRGGMNVIIEKSTGAFVGQCGLLIHVVEGVEELEIGYNIMPEFRKMGYASEAASKCKDHAFENNWRKSLISIIDVNNYESAGVAKKIGMTKDFETNYGGTLVNIFRVEKQ